VAGVPVGVLGGELGLADAAQPVQHARRARLRLAGLGTSSGAFRCGVLVGEGGDHARRGRGGRDELLVQAVKQLAAAGERQVARRQIGDRPPLGWPRQLPDRAGEAGGWM
jgi:hypothetical protein